jgi:tRNA 2-thiouridine synthesizing protein A
MTERPETVGQIDHARPDGAGLDIDAELDCKGLLCPLPIYQASAAMAGLEPGAVLRVECTDPGSIEDFPAFARQHRHVLLAVENRRDVQVFVLRKAGVR